MTIIDKIMRTVRRYGRGGRVFTPSDFVPRCGGRAAVDKALSRLAADGDLRRLRRGFYDWPRVSSVLKKAVPPSPDAVVAAIARRDGVTIMPDNIVAANELGVTDAVPAKPVYLTTGPSMVVTIGKRKIVLKHAPKNVFAWHKSRAGKVVQALMWLGKAGAQNASALAALGRSVTGLVKAALKAGLANLPLPDWARKIATSLAMQPA